MADLNALIAQGYQFQPLPDPFAQYGRMQQLENSAMQNRLAQQQMQESAQLAPLRMQEAQARLNKSNLDYDQAKEAKEYVAKVMSVAAEHGGPTDPFEAAKQMVSHPNPQIQLAGKHLLDSYQLIQGIEQQQKFNQGETGFAAPTTAPTAAYMPTSAQGTLGGPTPAMAGALGSGTFDVNVPAVPTVATPAAAAPAAPADKLSQIESRIAYLNKFPTVAQAKLEREELIKLRAELVKPYVVDKNLVTGTGNVIYSAPERAGYHVVANNLIDNTGKIIYEGPAGSTIQQVTNGDTISFVSVDNKTRVATPITQDGKPLTGVNVSAQDLAFRKQEAAFKQANPTLSIQKIGQSDGSEIVVAVNPLNATYQPVVAQGGTFVPSGPAIPLPSGMPSAAAPAIAPESGVAPAAVPNALVGGAVNNAFVSTPTGVGQPLISAAKKAPETKSDFERTLDSLNLTEDEKKVWRLARLKHDTNIATPAGERKSQLEQTMDDLNLSDKEKNAYRKRYLDKQTKSGGEGGGQGKPPTGYRWDKSGENLEKIPGGPADKEEKLKPIPPNINTAIGTNDMSIKRIEEALDLLKKYPDAVGFKNLLPGQALDRADPKGVAARSAIGDIGSLVIHDRSGAAVSQTEMQRLGFIPTPTDRADNAKTKLEAMLRWAKAGQQGLSETYSESQGYKPSPALAGKNKAAPANVSNW